MFSRIKKVSIVCALLLLAAATTQAQSAAQERAAQLQTQLTELQSRQADLQGRLDTLNEQLKPENIERSLAGVGSTRPEDLRELRRRQLEIEKSGIEKQLAVLSDSRTRLESSIGQADADAYQQSALQKPTENLAVKSPSSVDERPRRTLKKKVRPRRVNR